MREALSRGQLTIEQMVDRYPIRNQLVRQLLIDYFTRRAADTDYASISHMVLEIAHHFWEKIERINPDQADLRISPEVYATWRHMISTREDGKNAGGGTGSPIPGWPRPRSTNGSEPGPTPSMSPVEHGPSTTPISALIF
jgi:hypothetical protein